MADDPATATTVYVSSKARDVALYLCLCGFLGATGASFFYYPIYEAGAAIGINTLSALIGFLLGKAAANTPDRIVPAPPPKP